MAVGTGALLTVATVVANRLESRRRAHRLADAQEIAKEARTEAIETARCTIEPGLDALVHMAAERSRNARRDMAGKLEQLVVGLAAEIRPDARAAFFRYHESSERSLQWEKVWKAGKNRHHRPRSEFRGGDQGSGDDVLRVIDSGVPLLVPDVRQLQPHLRREPRDYESYITAPVVTDSATFGFLGVDAPNPYDLTQQDLNTVRLLAMILAVGLAVAD